MISLVSRRVAFIVLILFCVSILTFLIVNVLPGDVANAILGDLSTPDQLEAVRDRMGLDRPLIVRYLEWIGGMVHGDFGVSLKNAQPIGPILWARLQNSLLLAFLGLGVAVPVAVCLGVIAALRRNTVVDLGITTSVVVVFALPEYVTALALILIFSIHLDLLPGTSMVLPGQSVLGNPLALVLPVTVVALGLLAYLCQVTRASMIAVLNSGYVRTAVLKGLPRRSIVIRHALRNAMIPTLAEIGLGFGYTLGGLVVIESVFSYPGIGQLLVQAVQSRDVPTLQAAVLVVAVAYSLGNLLADIGSLSLNPRLRD